MSNRSYYVPRISRPLISRLYREAKARGVPMTVLVNQLIEDALAASGRVTEAHPEPRTTVSPESAM